MAVFVSLPLSTTTMGSIDYLTRPLQRKNFRLLEGDTLAPELPVPLILEDLVRVKGGSKDK